MLIFYLDSSFNFLLLYVINKMKTSETTNIITAAFNKWADKTWFQILFIVVLIYLLVAPILGPVLSNVFQREVVSESINNTLDTREEVARESHKINFEAARQAYTLIKHKMEEYIEPTKSEYIFLIEFHNGAENVITGIQFCRFDMTIEVSSDEHAYIPVEKFRDDIVARYDILLSEELGKNRLLYYTYKDFDKVDKYLTYQLSYINAKSYAILNLKDKDDKVFGSILCISTDNEDINLLSVRELAIELEYIFNKNIYTKYEYKE